MLKPAFGIRIALLNLLIAAFLGVTLRFIFIHEIPGIDFMKILHAHSHIAMLGWVFVAIYVHYIEGFLLPPQRKSSFYRMVFWLNQLAVMGMLVAFPLQGYGGWAIFFSTAQMILSYFFAYRFLKDFRKTPHHGQFSGLLVKASFFWMILSTLSLWAMGPIMALQLKGSALYYMSVQFYLHFQFNGWFLFAILALIFREMENLGLRFVRGKLLWFFYLLSISCPLTFLLAVTWSNPVKILFWLNSAGVLLQFAASALLIEVIWRNRASLKQKFGQASGMLTISLLAFVLKVLIQTVVIIPYIATIAYTIRNFVLGFIHLILLGVVTHFMLGISMQKGWLVVAARRPRLWMFLFQAGFIGSEFLLFLQGILLWAKLGFLPYYHEMLFTISAFMPVGLAIVLTAGSTGNSFGFFRPVKGWMALAKNQEERSQ